ncbi:MAG: hypothetical protein PUP92_19480 [Rhizonema sp. PD38]|nr:hypothetical protein [Rhizonema sp. PD38]
MLWWIKSGQVKEQQEIGKRLARDISTVPRWLQKYRTDGMSGLLEIKKGLSQTPCTTTLFDFWRDILHELSLRTRPYLLQDIKALFPVIFALGGEAVTAKVARAIEDVGQWWR